MSKCNLFSSKDILVVFGIDRRISGRLNLRWENLCKKVDANCAVPMEDRDAIYYAGLSILKHMIIDYMSLLEEFKDCKLITTSKYVTVVHEVDKLIKRMESECVYAT